MTRIRTMKALFRRNRRPGDIVFAWAFLALSAFLLIRLGDQTATKAGARLFAQPWFWPAVSLTGMTAFAALHLAGSALSERIAGRWREVATWAASLEYAGWFIAYAVAVPQLGYLSATVIFAVLLALRAGYCSARMLTAAGLSAIVVVVVFRTLLRVNLPAGAIYEHLPEGLRQIMLTNF
jgi:hypothetical protein